MNMTKYFFSALVAGVFLVDCAIAGNAIEAINVAQQGADIAIKIDFKDSLQNTPPGFAVSKPAKVAFDFSETVNSIGKNTQLVNQGDLQSINIVQVGERTRLVLNLIKALNYSTRLEGNSLYVLLSPIANSADTTAVRATRFSENTQIGGLHSIRDVIFRRGKDGEARIVVDLSDTGTGVDIRQQGSNLVVDFQKTLLPEHLRRKLDVTDFATPVVAVDTKSQGDNVRMIVTPKGLWEHNAYQADNQFVIEVKKIIEDPNKLVQGSKIGYQGPRVSINYQNGDVRALLRLMAEELGFNAVISETVTGTTTLVLKDVPADQVIDIIFQQKGLDMRKNGNVILIAPRDEISTREKLEFEAKQQIADLEPLRAEQFVLNYQKAVDVAKLLAGLSPLGGASGNTALKMLSKRGSVIADSQTNTLFINDVATKLDEIRTFIRAIDIAARQVLIEARIVEATDSFNKDLGMRLNFLTRGTQSVAGKELTFGGGTYVPNGTTTPTQATTTAAGVNLPSFTSTGGTLAFSLMNKAATRILNVELAALETDGAGKIVSSPRVVTANNVTAKIEDGTEVPYTTTSISNGIVTTTVTFKPAKLVLEATPQITPEGTIRMALQIKKEEPDWTKAILNNPPIKSSVVDTNVVVENGGTVVIGGVFITSNEKTTEKVPLLGDIPFFGWAFKYKNDQGTRRELLVFITPRIISEKMRLE